MVGHYETVIDALCTNEVSGGRSRPKIVGSTATISRAESQVKALYGRSAFLFPPQALRAGDSFFAEEEGRPGRAEVCWRIRKCSAFPCDITGSNHGSLVASTPSYPVPMIPPRLIPIGP